MADPQALAMGLMAPPQDGPVMRAYEPTWRDKIAAMIMGDQKPSPERRRLAEGLMGSSGLGTQGMGLVDFTPVGNVLGAQESAKHGDYRGAAINAMFLGPAARTADHVALTTAQKMAGQGAAREAIWKETGWFQGVDGKWRFEIPDNFMRTKPASEWSWGNREGFKQGEKAIGPAGEFISHSELQNAYPNGLLDFGSAETRLTGSIVPEITSNGGFMNEYGHSGLRLGLDENGLPHRQTALHELQHAIQEREGFASGGNPAQFADHYAGQPNARELAFADYQRLAGEVEARNVEKRMNMTAEERRATPPWQTQDVPDELQILRGLFSVGGN